MRAEDEANPCEHDRAADPGPLDPAGDRAVNEKERSQPRRVLVRLILQISQRALRGPPDRVMALIWIMPLVR
jgi:hypothetical protein